MKTKITYILYKEIELYVEYDVTPYMAATYLQPEEGGDIEITSVQVGGVDICSLLREEDFSKLEQLLIDELTD